jgi:hypothetical protein
LNHVAERTLQIVVQISCLLSLISIVKPGHAVALDLDRKDGDHQAVPE